MIVLTKREHMLGRYNEQTTEQILEYVGKKALKPWQTLHEFIEL